MAQLEDGGLNPERNRPAQERKGQPGGADLSNVGLPGDDESKIHAHPTPIEMRGRLDQLNKALDGARIRGDDSLPIYIRLESNLRPQQPGFEPNISFPHLEGRKYSRSANMISGRIDIGCTDAEVMQKLNEIARCNGVFEVGPDPIYQVLD